MWIPFSLSAPTAFRNLLNPDFDFVQLNKVQECLAEAATAFSNHNAGRTIEINGKKIDPNRSPRGADLQDGAGIIDNIARQLPRLGHDAFRYEIAAILCTDAFWNAETTALHKADPSQQPFRFDTPPVSAVNIFESDGKIFIQKTCCWQTVKDSDGHTIHLKKNAPILTTNVLVSFDVSRHDSLFQRAFGDKQNHELGLAIEYAHIESPHGALKNFLALHRESVLAFIASVIAYVFGAAGYYVGGNTEDVQKLITHYQPATFSASPVPQEDWKSVQENLFNEDRGTIALPHARKVLRARTFTCSKFGEISVLSGPTLQDAIISVIGPKEQAEIRQLTEEKRQLQQQIEERDWLLAQWSVYADELKQSAPRNLEPFDYPNVADAK